MIRPTFATVKRLLVILAIVFCVATAWFYGRNVRYSIRNNVGEVFNKQLISGSINSIQLPPVGTVQNQAVLGLNEKDLNNRDQVNSVDKAHVEANQHNKSSLVSESDKEFVVSEVPIQPLDDFIKYPCVPGIPYFPETNWPVTGKCVRTLNYTKTEEELHTKCVSLKTKRGKTPICTYDQVRDHFISKSLITSGQWEGDLVNIVVEFLNSQPDLEFLDLGCNIGTYTLAAALLGRKVVAVDAMIDNLELVQKSLSLGKLQNVILIWNAISGDYSKVALTKYQGNIGGTAIRNLTQDDIKKKEFITQTIRLDDLVPLFEGKRIVIKMDIETQEYNALIGGSTFFDVVDILMIQMEINWHRTRPSGPKIVEYLVERNFTAYTKDQKPLNISNISNWPGDVYFIKS